MVLDRMKMVLDGIIFMIVTLSLLSPSPANAQECLMINDVTVACLFTVNSTHDGNYTWSPPIGVNSVNASIWGGGGGGSSAVWITNSSTDGGTVVGYGFTAGGGAGSALSYGPLIWNLDNVTNQMTFQITIGRGGDGGTCDSISGSSGGTTSFTNGSITYYAYGGGGGGGSGPLGIFSGGGGGSGGSAFGHNGGVICTSECYAGWGLAGANGMIGSNYSGFNYISESSVNDGYWTLGGAGSYVSPNLVGSFDPLNTTQISYSTSSWVGPCLSTAVNGMGCQGTQSQVIVTSYNDMIAYNFAGAGAPGAFGSYAYSSDGRTQYSSGAGGFGCENATVIDTESGHFGTCSGCYGEAGGNGGALILYTLPGK